MIWDIVIYGFLFYQLRSEMIRLCTKTSLSALRVAQNRGRQIQLHLHRFFVNSNKKRPNKGGHQGCLDEAKVNSIKRCQKLEILFCLPTPSVLVQSVVAENRPCQSVEVGDWFNREQLLNNVTIFFIVITAYCIPPLQANFDPSPSRLYSDYNCFCWNVFYCFICLFKSSYPRRLLTSLLGFLFFICFVFLSPPTHYAGVRLWVYLLTGTVVPKHQLITWPNHKRRDDRSFKCDQLDEVWLKERLFLKSFFTIETNNLQINPNI